LNEEMRMRLIESLINAL